ncbi:C2H2-type zinc finger transcription factor [Phycomyces blakesleeanus]|uniref:C2H2-type zinc finger transcription factor n=2 Tax=Phycomyces blakesleeanus TaxID=4837 RepID=A0A167KWE7_PHYB8|nr:C2H2-type zinc finger transcription factor [Phycomyces blakesleeanus NRRL 1555(-)]OAD69039.1 C2H2-type zinc finger transcription factor [Phycomyces blakesleeanus NRRL 1555(-)]|eukprot:XP_018287079.1 C2H2-type zinc finger transcription factor [Phycomyces blakesleeanus NRRL 1555(-)]
MPAPIEYTPRRMSNILKQDISFEPYEFQLYHPQNNVKDVFESHDLEASFCRDFACCGLVLNDLHDLLQHYEECHVRLEEEDDNASLSDEDHESWSPPSYSLTSFDDSPTNPLSQDIQDIQLPKINSIKKKAAAYLSDLYNSSATVSPSSSSSTMSSENEFIDTQLVDEDSASKSQGKKRSICQTVGSANALDLLTQPTSKKFALSSSSTSDLPTPVLIDEDILAQAGALLATANTNSNADKPYKCPVFGCDKAYKNPNGLKYHNQHGHCNLVSDESENVASKPYQCTIGECGKRYKNLNGLKYHIEHSHMAALNHTLATFGSTIFPPSVQPIGPNSYPFDNLTGDAQNNPPATPIALPELF